MQIVRRRFKRRGKKALVAIFQTRQSHAVGRSCFRDFRTIEATLKTLLSRPAQRLLSLPQRFLVRDPRLFHASQEKFFWINFHRGNLDELTLPCENFFGVFQAAKSITLALDDGTRDQNLAAASGVTTAR